MSYEFYSFGCINDIDCAANLSSFASSVSIEQRIRSYPFNYQECRHYPTASLPNISNPSSNGCICTNYLTAAESIVDDNGNVYVTCTKVDGGSTYFFIFQALQAFVELYIATRCLFLLIYFSRSVFNSVSYQVSKFCGSRELNTKERMTLIRFHSLVCLVLLFVSTGCFGAYKISVILSFGYGIPDRSSPHGKQYRLSEYSLMRLYALGVSFLQLTGLHFSILWMSSTPRIFTEEAIGNDQSYFKPLWYKRIMFLGEIVTILPILIMLSNPTNDIYLSQLITGTLIVYEFVWGCQNITKILRHISYKLVSLTPGRENAQDDEIEASKTLLDMADRIDSLAWKIRLTGSLCAALYMSVFISFEKLRLYQSHSPSSNPRAHGYEIADALFVIMTIFPFNFLHESLFGLKKPSSTQQTAQNKINVISIGDLSAQEISRLQGMKSDESAYQSSLPHDKQPKSEQ